MRIGLARGVTTTATLLLLLVGVTAVVGAFTVTASSAIRTPTVNALKCLARFGASCADDSHHAVEIGAVPSSAPSTDPLAAFDRRGAPATSSLVLSALTEIAGGASGAVFGAVEMGLAGIASGTVFGVPAGAALGAIGTASAYASAWQMIMGASALGDLIAGDRSVAEQHLAQAAAWSWIGLAVNLPQTVEASVQLLKLLPPLFEHLANPLPRLASLVGRRSCPDGACLERSCFGAGTLVETDHGPAPIETLRLGDRVWSRDPATGVEAFKPVVRTFVTAGRTVEELALRDDGGAVERVTVTPNHPFWVEGRGWVPAAELAAAHDTVGARGRARLAVLGGLMLAATTTVYNLEVADFHTYFVGRSHAWVHNQCAPDGAPGRGLPVVAVAKSTLRTKTSEANGELTVHFMAQTTEGESLWLAMGNVDIDAHGQPTGAPSFRIEATRETWVREHSVKEAVHLYDEVEDGVGKGAKTSLTRLVLERFIEIYKQRFGREPEALTARLAMSNKLHFQREYFRLVSQGWTPDAAARAAASRISAGRHRIAIGYDHLEVTVDEFKHVDLGVDPATGQPLGRQLVPSRIDIVARKGEHGASAAEVGSPALVRSILDGPLQRQPR